MTTTYSVWHPRTGERVYQTTDAHRAQAESQNGMRVTAVTGTPRAHGEGQQAERTEVGV